jgi:hypothetical protein
METPTRKVGGVVRWYAKYRFRHVISGKYLAVQPRVSADLTYGKGDDDDDDDGGGGDHDVDVGGGDQFPAKFDVDLKEDTRGMMATTTAATAATYHLVDAPPETGVNAAAAAATAASDVASAVPNDMADTLFVIHPVDAPAEVGLWYCI